MAGNEPASQTRYSSNGWPAVTVAPTPCRLLPVAPSPCATPRAPCAPTLCRNPHKPLRHAAPEVRYTLSYTTYRCARPIDAAAHTWIVNTDRVPRFAQSWCCVTSTPDALGDRASTGLGTSAGRIGTGFPTCTSGRGIGNFAHGYESAVGSVATGARHVLQGVITYPWLTR